MKITMEHVLFASRNLEKALDFYRALFPSWNIRWEGNSYGTRWIHFGGPEDGTPYLSIYEAPKAERAKAPGGGAISIEHFGFRVQDLAGIMAGARERGLEPSDSAEDEDYRRVYYTDPDGHDLELVERVS
jgi:catechol 2,3-dioxygenase-like lactoylglutathione lyase family enzyme